MWSEGREGRAIPSEEGGCLSIDAATEKMAFELH